MGKIVYLFVNEITVLLSSACVERDRELELMLP